MFSLSLRRVFSPKFSHFETLQSVRPRLFSTSKGRMASLCFGLGISSFYYMNNYNTSANWLGLSSAASSSAASSIGSTTPGLSVPIDPDRSFVENSMESLQYLKRNKNISLKKASIYIRPINVKGLSPESTANSGICHAFIIVELGLDYICIERFAEGVSVKYLNEDQWEKQTKYCVLYMECETDIKSHSLADFCSKELKEGNSKVTGGLQRRIIGNCQAFIDDIQSKAAAYL